MNETGSDEKRRLEAEKRAQVLVTIAARILRNDGWAALSLERVAVEGGVTRRTVYNRFGTKLGLLEALFDQVLAEGDAKALAEAARGPSLDDALEVLALAACRLWAADRVLMRRLVGLAAIDPEVAKLHAARERRRRASVEPVVRRLAEEAGLAPGLTADEASRSALAITSFQTFDALATRDGSDAGVARILVRMLSSLRADFQVAQPVKRAGRRG